MTYFLLYFILIADENKAIIKIEFIILATQDIYVTLYYYCEI